MMIKASIQNTVNTLNTVNIPVKANTLVKASILQAPNVIRLAITIDIKREGIIKTGNHLTLDLKPR